MDCSGGAEKTIWIRTFLPGGKLEEREIDVILLRPLRPCLEGSINLQTSPHVLKRSVDSAVEHGGRDQLASRWRKAIGAAKRLASRTCTGEQLAKRYVGRGMSFWT